MTKDLPEANEIEGFSKLSKEAQEIFKGFLNNYYKSFEFPEDHEVIVVSIAHEGRGKHKITFIKAECADKEWFHVVSKYSWY